MHGEYKRRALSQHDQSGFRRFRYLFCLFTKYQEENGPDHSTVEIGRYDSETNSWKEHDEIIFGDRIRFTVILNQSKIYAFGGSSLNDVYLNAVSTKSEI